MKRFAYSAIGALTLLTLLPELLICAKSHAAVTLPKVSIIYPGDTDKTIIRRAKWIEGAKKEGTLAWWGSNNPNVMNEIFTEFKKVYPFIKLDYWRGQDVERITRLEAEHSIGRATTDLCDSGDLTAHQRWRGLGLVDQYTDVIPGINNFDKGMYSKHGDWVQLGVTGLVPMYNTKLVSPTEAPRRWEDFLDPKWKGKIGMESNMRTWYILALGEGGWGIEKTEDFLRKLKQQELIWAPGASAGFNLLIAGEYKVMVHNFLRYILQKKDSPIDWVRVSPTPVSGATFLLTKKAPHPNAARLFIEWLFSPQGMTAYERITGYGVVSPGSGTRMALALAGLPLIYRTEEVVMKTAELKLVDRFSKIVGITAE